MTPMGRKLRDHFMNSGWVPESVYDEPASPSNAHESSSPQHSSSHDEYIPSPGNTPPPLSSASDVHTTPSHRSSTANVSHNARKALRKLYKRIYGHDSKRCLVTQKEESVVIAHIVRRASKPDQVRKSSSRTEYDLDISLAFTL
jgi:hypothetical protein